VPDYNQFTLPDYDQFTLPDLPQVVQPTFSYNDDYDDYNSGSSSSNYSPGTLVGSMVAIIAMSFLIFCFRYYRFRQQTVFRQNCFVRPIPTEINTSRTNLVSQRDEQPSIVVITITGQNDGRNGLQNLPPDGEPPFLSEEDILHSLSNVPAEEPPSYEEPTGPLPQCPPYSSQPPKYEDLQNINVETPPYNAVQARSSGSSMIAPPIQEEVNIPAVSPPSYDAALH
jgi:hypothetical protein